MPTEIASLSAPQKVATALQRASDATGAGFDFLKAMAARESSFDADAKAKTSSAAGLFQFIEQTWLGAVKQYGAKHGLGAEAADIRRDANGRFSVANETRRDEILNLRFDAGASAKLAGELSNQNKTFLENRLGRGATSADLYTAHFLGPAGAVKLLGAASSVKAAALLPKAADANRPVFYDGARAKSVGEVIASIAASMGVDGKAVEQKPAAPSATRVAAVRTVPMGGAPVGRVPMNVNEMAALRLNETSSLPAAKISHASRFATAIHQLPGLAPSSRLSALAMTALQALDPTRLASDRENQDNKF